MSDTQQGPGWWRAGDGKWHPPNAGQVPPVYRPMPDPQQQGGMSNGTLMAIIGGLGAVLIGLVVLGVLASDGDGDGDPTAADSVDERETDEPAAGPLSALSDEEREERADVELTDCGPGQFNDMVATLEVTNHSSEPSLTSSTSFLRTPVAAVSSVLPSPRWMTWVRTRSRRWRHRASTLDQHGRAGSSAGSRTFSGSRPSRGADPSGRPVEEDERQHRLWRLTRGTLNLVGAEGLEPRPPPCKGCRHERCADRKKPWESRAASRASNQSNGVQFRDRLIDSLAIAREFRAVTELGGENPLATTAADGERNQRA